MFTLLSILYSHAGINLLRTTLLAKVRLQNVKSICPAFFRLQFASPKRPIHHGSVMCGSILNWLKGTDTTHDFAQKAIAVLPAAHCNLKYMKEKLGGDLVFGKSLINRNRSWGSSSMDKLETFPLTKREAFVFVEDILEMPDASKKLGKDRKSFLEEFIKRWYIRIPFTPIKYQSQIVGYNNFKFPTFLEIKEDMFSRIGGTCVPMTCFTQALLSHLGYESYICDSGYADISSNHNAIIVRHLSGLGSKHLVDIGGGVPFFRAVPLDFENVSPVYRDDYMTYRYVKEADGTITCQKILEDDHYWDLRSSDFITNGKIGEWVSFMTYETETPLDLDFFVKSRKKLFEVQNLRPHILYSILLIGFPKGRLCSITSTALYRATTEGRIESTKLKGADAVEVLLRYYPQFPRSTAEAALFNSQTRLRN